MEEISQASEYRMNKIDVKEKLPEKKKKKKRVLQSGYLSIKTASNFYSAKKKNQNMSNTHTSIF